MGGSLDRLCTIRVLYLHRMDWRCLMDLSYGLTRVVVGGVHCQEQQSNRGMQEVRWRYAAEVGMVPRVDHSLHGLGVGLEEEHSSSH